jgi:uncharacterized repeat protein (TIGR02543 family)
VIVLKKRSLIKILILSLIFIFIFIVSGCIEKNPLVQPQIDNDENEPLPDTYLLSITVNPYEAGIVLKTPAPNADGTYPNGTSVKLTALPASGYHFNSWSGDLTGNTNPVTIIIDSLKDITATFEKTTFKITISVYPEGRGIVLLTPAPNADGTYPSGTSVKLTALPASGYHFNSWSGDLTGNTNPVTIIIDNNKNITANFYKSAIPVET